jgi:hypothetical protein
MQRLCRVSWRKKKKKEKKKGSQGMMKKQACEAKK